jgi:hypothetical protein
MEVWTSPIAVFGTLAAAIVSGTAARRAADLIPRRWVYC